MIHIICMECNFGLRVSPGTDGEIESIIGPHDDWYPDHYPCTQCMGPAGIVSAVDGAALAQVTLVDVSPFEAFAAFHGLGLPEERECSPAAVEKLLTGARIKHVATRTIRNSHRSLLEYIELEDGTRIYLAASTFGATVYRISKPKCYVEEALHGS